MTHARRLAALERSLPKPKPGRFSMTIVDRARGLAQLYRSVRAENPDFAPPGGIDPDALLANLDNASEAEEAERIAADFVERVRAARLQARR